MKRSPKEAPKMRRHYLEVNPHLGGSDTEKGDVGSIFTRGIASRERRRIHNMFVVKVLLGV